VELTITLVSGCADAIPAPVLSANATPPETTTSFTFDSMALR
jgi:hypothetical protein